MRKKINKKKIKDLKPGKKVKGGHAPISGYKVSKTGFDPGPVGFDPGPVGFDPGPVGKSIRHR